MDGDVCNKKGKNVHIEILSEEFKMKVIKKLERIVMSAGRIKSKKAEIFENKMWLRSTN